MIVKVLGKMWKVEVVKPGEEVPAWATHGWYPDEQRLYKGFVTKEDCYWGKGGPWPIVPPVYKRSTYEQEFFLLALMEVE